MLWICIWSTIFFISGAAESHFESNSSVISKNPCKVQYQSGKNIDSIPPNLITFYHDKSRMPSIMSKQIQKLKDNNSGFKFKLFDVKSGEMFLKYHCNADTVEAYNMLIPYAYKSDLFRYAYLYVVGGIYVDVKYQSVNGFSFSELLNEEYFVNEPQGFIQNCLLVTRNGNRLLRESILEVIRHVKERSLGGSPLFTGPKLLNDTYTRLYRRSKANFKLKWIVSDKGTHQILRNNDLILREYDGYRKEIRRSSDQKYYTKLWWDKKVFAGIPPEKVVTGL
jgi:mannosyltransferase OCH1-like enzyme